MHQNLLNWYNKNARIMPWRVDVFEHTNPYHVMVSEFMLQQTTVATVIPYFLRFIEKFPTVESLAKAHIDEVLILWQGLGYYRRAKNLHATSQQISHLGYFPRTYDQLLQLKGVGEYTAAAIASIGFNQPIIPVDGNVKRVWSRFYATDLDAKNIKSIWNNFSALMQGSEKDAFKVSQALMELGATICLPKITLCDQCPLQTACVALKKGEVGIYPKVQKNTKAKPFDLELYLLIDSKKKRILIKKNSDKGLFADMYFLPSNLNEPFEFIQRKHSDLIHQYKHVLSHYRFNVSVLLKKVIEEEHLIFLNDPNYLWIELSERGLYSFPKLITKALDSLLP